MSQPQDWRRQGQERYLAGRRLRYQQYQPYREGWDHDHCEFCLLKFSRIEGDENHGYVTDDNYHWICRGCFEHFRDEFLWTQVE